MLKIVLRKIKITDEMVSTNYNLTFIIIFSIRVRTRFGDCILDHCDVSYYRAKWFGRGSLISQGTCKKNHFI